MTPSVLTDKGVADGKPFAIINDIRYGVPSYVVPFLSEIEKGTRVEYNESNQILTRIWRQKSVNKPEGKNLLIALQHNFGIVADSYFSCYPLEDDPDFNSVMEIIYVKTREISERMIADSGVIRE